MHDEPVPYSTTRQPVNGLQEPIEASAPLAHSLAMRLCCAAPGGGSCAWNHGLWQYLRLFGLITAPEHHTRFYARALGKVAAGTPAARVLISGAADYGMLAQVLHAFRSAGCEPDVTVLDACETPLELCRWYATRERCAIQTCRSDILDYATAERFDAVCTHSFLGQFDARGRAKLASKWFDLLRPGGCVATVNRVRPGRAGQRHQFSAEQAEVFVNEVADHVARTRLPANVEASTLTAMAREYAEKFGGWSVDSEAEIRNLFEGAGFRIDALDCEPVARHDGDRISGPSTPGGAQYACALASRPR